MKNQFSIVANLGFSICLAFSPKVFSSSIGSIYNTIVVDSSNEGLAALGNVTLVQDADDQNKYYYIPAGYHIKVTSTDDEQGNIVTNYGFQNLISLDATPLSIYTIQMELIEVDRLALELAQGGLAGQTHNPKAYIDGRVPICGLDIGVPLGATAKVDQTNPYKIIYSIAATGADCNDLISNTNFAMQIQVPLSQEPTAIALHLASEEGLTLPPIQIQIPMKLKATANISINLLEAQRVLEAQAGLAGSFKYLSASLNDAENSFLNTSGVSAKLNFDCQNNGKNSTFCETMKKQVMDLLTQSLVTFVSQETADGKTPTFGTLTNSANMDAVSLKFNRTDSQIEKDESLKVDFSQSNYTSLGASLQLDLSQVPIDKFSPKIQALILQSQRN